MLLDQVEGGKIWIDAAQPDDGRTMYQLHQTLTRLESDQYLEGRRADVPAKTHTAHQDLCRAVLPHDGKLDVLWLTADLILQRESHRLEIDRLRQRHADALGLADPDLGR